MAGKLVKQGRILEGTRQFTEPITASEIGELLINLCKRVKTLACDILLFVGSSMGDDFSRPVSNHQKMLQHICVVGICGYVEVVTRSLHRCQQRHQLRVERRNRANWGVRRTRKLSFELVHEATKMEARNRMLQKPPKKRDSTITTHSGRADRLNAFVRTSTASGERTACLRSNDCQTARTPLLRGSEVGRLSSFVGTRVRCRVDGSFETRLRTGLGE